MGIMDFNSFDFDPPKFIGRYIVYDSLYNVITGASYQYDEKYNKNVFILDSGGKRVRFETENDIFWSKPPVLNKQEIYNKYK